MNESRPHTAFHTLSVQDALDTLAGEPGGLTTTEAARRLADIGPNRLPEPPKRSPFLRFLSHFHNVLIYVLIASAAVTGALQHWVDTGVILAVVIVNAVIGYIQEGRAEQAMDAIRGMLAPRSAVLRDGRRVSVDATELVPGDIVLVEAGDRVPADLRLIEARGLKAEEAILTGESVPVDKGTAPATEAAALGDRTSMLFSGTLVAAGTGRGVVATTGPDTQIGRISGMLARVQTLTTPLVAQMDGFARWLTVFILFVAGALLAYGYFVGHLPFSDLFMAVVGLSVAAIPEGLPAVLTITLAVGVQAMARRNAIVRRLPAIETLGSVSVICSDKTGTLTRNEMMAAALAAAGHIYSVGGNGYAPEGAVRWREADVDPDKHAVLTEFARAAGLCNDAMLHAQEAGWRVEGDPMEGALMALAGKITREGAEPFRQWSRTDAIPFDAAHRYMAVLHHDHEGQAFIHVKGAPEAVLALCADQRAAPVAEGGGAPGDAHGAGAELGEVGVHAGQDGVELHPQAAQLRPPLLQPGVQAPEGEGCASHGVAQAADVGGERFVLQTGDHQLGGDLVGGVDARGTHPEQLQGAGALVLVVGLGLGLRLGLGAGRWGGGRRRVVVLLVEQVEAIEALDGRAQLLGLGQLLLERAVGHLLDELVEDVELVDDVAHQRDRLGGPPGGLQLVFQVVDPLRDLHADGELGGAGRSLEGVEVAQDGRMQGLALVLLGGLHLHGGGRGSADQLGGLLHEHRDDLFVDHRASWCHFSAGQGSGLRGIGEPSSFPFRGVACHKSREEIPCVTSCLLALCWPSSPATPPP